MKMKKVLALVLTGAMALGSMNMAAFAEEAGTPLVVGINSFSAKFSPFFHESVPDMEIVELTQLSLISMDRAGGIIFNGAHGGETIPYNGTDYTYDTLADITVTENEDNTVYNFKLRDDVVFSDGEPLTADDVIFSMYVYADPDYDGFSTFNTTSIKGMQNYILNSSAADTITDEDVQTVLTEMPEEVAGQITEMVAGLLSAEYDWAADAWEDYAADMGVANGEEFFAALYATEDGYTVEGKDKDTIVNEVAAMYGTDYVALAGAYGDEEYFNEDASKIAKGYLVEQMAASGEGEEVPNIEGIKKLGDYEIEVTTDGFDAQAIYQLGLELAPMHYFGNPDLYDYENNQFGFTRGDLSEVRSHSAEPMVGAGPYNFVKYENKTVYLEANPNYYKGEPKIKSLQFRETNEPDMVAGVEQGTIDLADPANSKEKMAQIASINSNGEVNGDVINTSLVDNAGYGYIGISAKTVKVGDDSASEQSKALRKALATILSVYRTVTIDSYYGEAASVIDYPISATSWAAPQKSDADYQVAYSKDVDGNPIFTEDMTDEDKFAAALEASKGYFEAAGYTFDENGMMTAAPEGAKMSYQVTIGGAGTGDHPTFAVLTDAKEALAKIGFTLEINDITDQNILWDSLTGGTAELWAAAWSSTPDPDMYQIYHSESKNSNHYFIADPDLDAKIMDARSTSDQAYRKSVYKECLDIVLDWAVEVPVYQRQNCIIYSTQRINADTFVPDIATFYPWYAEIENMEMN